MCISIKVDLKPRKVSRNEPIYRQNAAADSNCLKKEKIQCFNSELDLNMR